ncbi:NAD(P)-binding protein [Zalerion maritima]|uniref:NAD(P)-binding protein n=1 Tax=Zalerion maritima TaxID=339359 RepID=A0AAD5WR66_9PEZI|nr:NAD(P)-binding protein [Zalerion maritima]
MRAVLQLDFSQPAVLFNPSVPVPSPSEPDDHLIRVSYTSPTLNELNWATFAPDTFAAKPLPIPCYDVSGTVVAAPPDSPFQPGEKIFARMSAYRQGAAAEYAIAKTHVLALAPEKMDLAMATCVPMSAETAWQFLFDSSSAKHGRGVLYANAITAAGGTAERKVALEANAQKRVIITGAAGGVGRWMVQLASVAGAKVIGVVRGVEKAKAVAELGATEVVDTNVESITSWIAADQARKADLVIDCVGMQVLGESWSAVKDGGVILSIVMPPEMVKPKEGAEGVARNEFFIVEPTGEQLSHVAKLIDAGVCKQSIDSIFELEDAEKAFEKVEKEHPLGKVVIKVAGQV